MTVGLPVIAVIRSVLFTHAAIVKQRLIIRSQLQVIPLVLAVVMGMVQDLEPLRNFH